MDLSATSMTYLLLSTQLHNGLKNVQEKKIGKICYPAAGLSAETIPYYTSAYDMDMRKVIDVYAAATKHVDQGHFTDSLYAQRYSKGSLRMENGKQTNDT